MLTQEVYTDHKQPPQQGSLSLVKVKCERHNKIIKNYPDYINTCIPYSWLMWWDPSNHFRNKCIRIFLTWPLWVTDKKNAVTCFFISGKTHSHSLFNDHLILPTKQRALAKIFHSDLLADVQFQRIWLDVFTSLHETGCKIHFWGRKNHRTCKRLQVSWYHMSVC